MFPDSHAALRARSKYSWWLSSFKHPGLEGVSAQKYTALSMPATTLIRDGEDFSVLLIIKIAVFRLLLSLYYIHYK
jgi:hypothetical protein